MKKILFFVLLAGLGCRLSGQIAPKLGVNTNKEVIGAMTMEEKARLVVGMGMHIPGVTLPPEMSGGPVVGQTQDKVPGAAGTTATFERLGIPTIVLADGPAGLRIAPQRPGDDNTYYCTAFPIATLLASTWDADLVRKTGQAMGHEVKEYGADVILGPGMNIQRNALGGRNFEYYSEDPLLSGKMAAAMVTGIQSNGVGVSIKHFAANNHESNRNTINVKVSQRALREIYLRGFEIAVKEAKPWTVMSSYNKINGTYTSQNADLLKKVLREDWGYKGLVMTDWFGGDNAVEQMKAGNELLMPGTGVQLNKIIEAVKNGELDEKVLDENVDKILNTIKESPAFKQYKFSNQPNLKQNAQIARQVAAEGMVLLKNTGNTLPIKAKSTLAVFGNFSYSLVSGGTGSGDVNEAYTISLPEGLIGAEYKLSERIKNGYESYIKAEKAKQPKDRPFFLPPPPIEEMQLGDGDIENAAMTTDLAIITIGRIAGEFTDRKADNDFYLTEAEKSLLTRVSDIFHANGKKVVVIINVGGSVEMVSWRDRVDAILMAWQPGQEAGYAIADVLSGKVNPSGKLAATIPVRFEDDPTSVGFPGREYGDVINMGVFQTRLAEIEYPEGVFVGYRAFDKKKITPAYEFGYGLSYTTFEYSNLKISASTFKDKITASVTVKNTGNTAGKEVVQLYLSAPAQTMEKPEQELKGFAKTKLLKPGESQTISIEFDARALASFDEKTSAWVAEKGSYTVKVGASSRLTKLKANFNLPKTLTLEKVSNALPMK